MKIVKEDRMERTKMGNAITMTSAMARLPLEMGRNPSPHKRPDIIALSIPIPTIALFNQNELVIFI